MFMGTVSRLMGAIVVIAIGLAMATGDVSAKDKRYNQDWRQQNQAPGHDATQELVKELNALINQASRSRAADPLFLRDLSDLARRFSWPWPRRVLFDNFSDGELSQNPAWVASGHALMVDRFIGVRSQVIPSRRHGSQNQAPRSDRLSKRDIAAQIFATILQQQAQARQPQQRQARSPYKQPAKMTSAVRLANAFALRTQIASDTKGEGRFELGVTQGPNGLGYRVIYNAGGTPSIELVRIGRRGSSVIDASRKAVKLEDNAHHTLQFTRSADGTMTVSVDDVEVIRTQDRAFRDGFDGILMMNKGGDFTIRAITAYSS
ncbi:MAG: hypothetical protein HN403_04820 [Rhodospirillales bacterium]|jgi:hypothetical protein|nr:hypothetical protein [Rhodospirillales bacterium]